MSKTLLIGLILTSLSFSTVSQNQKTDIDYKWDEVIKINLYYQSNNNDYCNMEKIKEIVGDSIFMKPFKWTDLLDIITDWNKEEEDVLLEEECIAIEVDFGKEKIAFAVFLEQGVLFDLTENTFQYLNIPDKEKFKKIIKQCIN